MKLPPTPKVVYKAPLPFVLRILSSFPFLGSYFTDYLFFHYFVLSNESFSSSFKQNKFSTILGKIKKTSLSTHNFSSFHPYLPISFINYLYYYLHLCFPLLQLLQSDSCSHHYMKTELCLKSPEISMLTQWLDLNSFQRQLPFTSSFILIFCDTIVTWFSPSSLIFLRFHIKSQYFY